MTRHNFQVNLEGIIKLLSDSLYAEERVFIRELIQNAQDAIVARRREEPQAEGYRIDVYLQHEEGERLLKIRDTGLGLTEPEIHSFLSTIGLSSKSDQATIGRQGDDYIGQFGIGLLSGFLVSEEIEMMTQSCKGGPAMHWKGHQNGSYSIEPSKEPHPIGSTVILRPKSGYESFFTYGELKANLRHFADLLPYPIYLYFEGIEEQINRASLPWEDMSSPNWRSSWLDYGQEVFGKEFKDVVPIYAEPDGSGDLLGIGFVVPYQGMSRPPSRVYLKRMLLTDKATDLLPQWAFFIQVVINSNNLSPTASRETIYPDEELDYLKASIDEQLREYIREKLVKEPVMRDLLLTSHLASVLGLAQESRPFFDAIYPMLPVNTNRGSMTFGEFIQENNPCYFTYSEEIMSQLKTMANTHGMLVLQANINLAGEFLDRYCQTHPQQRVKQISQDDLLALMGEEIEMTSKDEIFLEFCDRALEGYSVTSTLRKLEDEDLPAMYIPDSGNRLLRLAETNKKASANPFLAAVDMGILGGGSDQTLCLNQHNPLVQSIQDAYADHPDALGHCVRILYVQALMASGQPLRQNELEILSEGMGHFLELLR